MTCILPTSLPHVSKFVLIAKDRDAILKLTGRGVKDGVLTPAYTTGAGCDEGRFSGYARGGMRKSKAAV